MKRYERKDITGAEHWEVNAAGRVYRNRREKDITYWLGGLPSVDLGESYVGPLLGSNGGIRRWGPDEDDQKESGEDLHCHHRLIDEIVALEFIGKPRWGWARTRVGHRDGDQRNNFRENLYYKRMLEVDAHIRRKRLQNLMRCENRSGRGLFAVGGDFGLAKVTRPSHQLLFVGAPNIPGMIPIPPKGQS
jgi:hypothetical protein